eukprot:2135928-Amphidinium_carterae.2
MTSLAENLIPNDCIPLLLGGTEDGRKSSQRHSSTVQAVIGLNSAESEYYTLTNAAYVALGLQTKFRVNWQTGNFQQRSRSTQTRQAHERKR